MKVHVVPPSSQSIQGDFLAVPVFADEPLPEALNSCPGAADARSKPGHVTVLRPNDDSLTARIAAVGVGPRGKLTAEAIRVAAAKIEAECRRLELTELAWSLPTGDSVDAKTAVRALISGTVLSNFAFEDFKSKGRASAAGASRDYEKPGEVAPGEDEESDHVTIATLNIEAPDGTDSSLRTALAAAAESERVAAEAQNFARTLQATPANSLTPARLARYAADIAASSESLSDETLDEDELHALGMGGMTAVSQGSAEASRLIVLRYSNAGEDAPTLGLVGKSVTFDTGGISLKPPASMHEMKMDMSGGAAVLAAVSAIVRLEIPINLVAVLPAVENMPSDRAVKPGDVITQYDGTTVEVNNTDAEGRLVLADALTYCNELGATKIVDLATLTGAVLIALGSTCAATMSNDDEFAAQVEAAGEEAGDLVWRLPLNDDYRKLIKGKVADLSNAAAKREAGTIYAGAFLEHFIGETPWVHIDIAGTAWDTGKPYFGSGPTGYGVRLLVTLAERWAEAGK